MAKNDNLQIPFVKPVRVGNFKLWRGKYNLASGKEKNVIDCLHVSSLDGSWMIRIPSTMQMYAFLCSQYATTDTDMRDNFIGMVLTNVYNVSTLPSPAVHDGFFFLTEMMSFPYLLLPEEDMVKRMKKTMKDLGFDKARRKEHIAKMCEYRAELYDLIEKKKDAVIADYERQQAMQREYERVAEEEDLKRDEIAEQAMEALSRQ